MLEPRTPERIEHLFEVMVNTANTADDRQRVLMISQLYLLAEDLIGRSAQPDVDLKGRIRLLIDRL